MGKREWGRRRSDNQPYPKSRGKEALPRNMSVAKNIGRLRRYRVPYSITRDLGYGPETAMGHRTVRARTRSSAIEKAGKLVEEQHPHAKIRIKPDSVKRETQSQRRQRTHVKGGRKKNNPCPEKK